MKELITKEEQFLDFLDKSKGLIVKVAGVYCYDREERKDLIQEIILQIWKSYQKFDDSYPLSTWIYRIALNVSISYLRKMTSRKRTYEIYRKQTEFVQWDDHSIDEQLAQLYHFIGFLTPIDKAVIILHLDGVNNSEVADILGLRPTNVSTKLHRIKDKLKSYFITLTN